VGGLLHDRNGRAASSCNRYGSGAWFELGAALHRIPAFSMVIDDRYSNKARIYSLSLAVIAACCVAAVVAGGCDATLGSADSSAEASATATYTPTPASTATFTSTLTSTPAAISIRPRYSFLGNNTREPGPIDLSIYYLSTESHYEADVYLRGALFL
jgi:hypothetical protein